MSEELCAWTRGPVRWFGVDRPHTRNAWTFAMGEELHAYLTEAETDEEVRVVVLTGRRGHFSSGVDRAELARGVRPSPFPVEAFTRFPKPTIACVDGVAFGMGTASALACDLRVASTRASFTLGFGRLGLTPEWGTSFLLWRQIGWSRTMDLYLSDRTVAAEEALRIGLVDRVVAPDDVEDETQALAEQIATLPIGTAEAIKAVLWSGLETSTFAAARAVEMRAIFERGLARAPFVGEEGG